MSDLPKGPTTACEALADALAETALGVASAADREAVMTHVAGCPACALELDELTAVGQQVLAVAPEAAPPPGLTQRVLAARVAGVGSDVAWSNDGGEAPVADPRPVASPFRGRRWLAAVAAVVLLVGAGVVGAAAARSRAGTDSRAEALDRVAVTDVRTGQLVTDDGRSIGTAMVTGGADPVLVMTLDRVTPGVPYGCALVAEDGTVTEVGAWAAASEADRSWAVSLDPAVVGDSQVVLTVPGGKTLGTADLH